MKFLWELSNNYKQTCLISEDEQTIDNALSMLEASPSDKVRYTKGRIPILEASDYKDMQESGIITVIVEYSRLNDFKEGPKIITSVREPDALLFKYGHWKDFAIPSVKIRTNEYGFTVYARFIGKTDAVDRAKDMWKNHPANPVMTGYYLKWFAEADLALDLDFDNFLFEHIDQKTLDEIDPHLWRFE